MYKYLYVYIPCTQQDFQNEEKNIYVYVYRGTNHHVLRIEDFDCLFFPFIFVEQIQNRSKPVIIAHPSRCISVI